MIKYKSYAEELKEEGIEQGIEQGREQGIEQVIRNMLKQGFDLSAVTKATGLSKSKVNKIKESIKSLS